MTDIELCRSLLLRAEDLRHHDPPRALRLAKEARDRAARLDRAKTGPRRWFTLQADAWSVLGSTLRSVSDLRGAESAFNIALCFLNAPELPFAVDPLAHARLAQRAAHLRCYQERFEEALELIDETIATYHRAGATQRWAGACADRGLILGYAGCKEEAVMEIVRALDQLDPFQSPRNFLAAVHNTAFFLHEMADDSEADLPVLEWLDLAERCHALLPENVSLFKLRNLQGLTAIRSGHIEEGIRELWEVQEGFHRLGAFYEQAFVLLQLAATYSSQGRNDDVKRVAGQLFPMFQGLDADSESRAALMLFCRAAHAETVTLDLIERVSGDLRQAYGEGANRTRFS